MSSVAIVFPGQGSQHLNMLSQGAILDIAKSSEYSHLVELCSDLVSLDFIDLVENGPEDSLNKTSITQPILLLTSFFHYQNLVNQTSVDPLIFAGHSLGEYSALVAANSLGIEDGLKLVRKRGLLMEEAPSGSMAAILGLDFLSIEEICEQVSTDQSMQVQCANLNSPSQTVISGSIEAVAKAQELCLEAGAKRAITLKVSIASHSPLMESVQQEYHAFLSTIELKVPNVSVLHNVNNSICAMPDEIKNLLVQQLYSPVQWVNICKEISALCLPVIECGPGKVLGGLFKANGVNDYFSTADTNFYEKILTHVK
ncbi:MAG: ACP S-malonyltransferase [Gammaproteobacteria bacterium]|jgi:[acyl-carrier-protein] S-malonyltransferase|nr:ACP S-malonyltransferase [Gammaproteobacteria bacterium]